MVPRLKVLDVTHWNQSVVPSPWPLTQGALRELLRLKSGPSHFAFSVNSPVLLRGSFGWLRALRQSFH
jgi:hypothetical protein